MTTTKLDVDLLPKLERITAILDDYDPVTQQKLLELASVRYAMRAGSMSGVVVAGMHKHINQILNQKGTQ
jgi:hypothetical protein